MAVDFQTCRRIQHRWDELDGPPAGYEHVVRNAFWLRCERCAMVRAFEVSRHTGQVTWSRYWPAEGYYWTDKTQPAPTRQDYRIDWLRELMAKRQQAEGRERVSA